MPLVLQRLLQQRDVGLRPLLQLLEIIKGLALVLQQIKPFPPPL